MTDLDDLSNGLDIKGIAASAGMALRRLRTAQLTGERLRLAAFTAHAIPPGDSDPREEVRELLASIPLDDLHSLGREFRRTHLITAIGILDFSLTEILTFLASSRPEVLERLPKDLRKGEEPLERAVKGLRRTKIRSRLDHVAEALGIPIDEGLIEELAPLVEKRNAITHESKYYETVRSEERVAIRPRPFPEVTKDECDLALMTVTEILDGILVGVAKEYFSLDLGDLRPLLPELAELHQAARQRMRDRRLQGPQVEIVERPNWSLLVRDNSVWIVDEGRNVSIKPTGIDRMPVLIRCLGNDVPGEEDYITIDDGEREEAGLQDMNFLARLLSGRSMLLEFHTLASDVPSYLRVNLMDLGSRWTEALAARAAVNRD